MNLFVDTISNPAIIILFDSKREIIDKLEWDLKGNESSLLIPKIDDLIKRNNIEYNDLEKLIVVNGPGSFTGIRTTVLAINSINYIINKHITAIGYFDLFKQYPIVKSSSKRDCFIKFENDKDILIIENEKLKNILNEKNIKVIYGEANNEVVENIKIIDKIDYISIIKNIKYDEAKQIQALYIKKPNIS